MMTMREKRFAQHVSELCAAFKVKLRVNSQLRPEEAKSYLMVSGRTGKPFNMIEIAPVTDETTYAVALHELGHCEAPLGRVHHVAGSGFGMILSWRDVKLQFDAEQAAWEWARHYALEWTELMTTVERYSLESYSRRAQKVGVKL